MALEENRFGRYQGRIQYTGLTSCITLTFFTPPDMFVGAHFVVSKANQIPAILRGMAALQANLMGAPTIMLIVGPTTMWNSDNVTDERWLPMNMPHNFKAGLNYNGDVYMCESPGAGESLVFTVNNSTEDISPVQVRDTNGKDYTADFMPI